MTPAPFSPYSLAPAPPRSFVANLKAEPHCWTACHWHSSAVQCHRVTVCSGVGSHWSFVRRVSRGCRTEVEATAAACAHDALRGGHSARRRATRRTDNLVSTGRVRRFAKHSITLRRVWGKHALFRSRSLHHGVSRVVALHCQCFLPPQSPAPRRRDDGQATGAAARRRNMREWIPA